MEIKVDVNDSKHVLRNTKLIEDAEQLLAHQNLSQAHLKLGVKKPARKHLVEISAHLTTDKGAFNSCAQGWDAQQVYATCLDRIKTQLAHAH